MCLSVQIIMFEPLWPGSSVSDASGSRSRLMYTNDCLKARSHLKVTVKVTEYQHQTKIDKFSQNIPNSMRKESESK